MKNNPLVPYILIMAFGIGLIFFMSLEGGNKEEAAEGETTGETAAIDGKALAEKSCVSCHGADFTGSFGPKIAGLDAAHIADVAMNGFNTMSPVIQNEEEAKAIAEYISGL